MPIDFEHDLNPEQLQAALHTDGPVLVISGAGSGKTRTIVYRLARLVELGVPPEQILLLTFTRKAAQEMLSRAGALLNRPLAGTGGGTFHSFAYSVLRRHPQLVGTTGGITLMDRGDAEDAIRDVRDGLGLGKSDRSFPKRATVADCITKSRNKELPLKELLEREAYHLMPYLGDLEALAAGYESFKRGHGLADYDDLLFLLERALTEQDWLREELRTRHRYIMVDEYQDTNLVQARIVRLLAGRAGNVMAVGDDAQSIYAFRGANVANILDFPKDFPGARIIRLERNYRSTQPILDLTNHILDGALQKFDKRLVAARQGGNRPLLVQPLSDQSQARQVLNTVIELARRHPLHEIAVLFRAGYQSFPLEAALSQMGLAYQKYGGIRFHEAAHVKDALAYLRLTRNPADLLSWQRALAHIKGVGTKTATRIAQAILAGDQKALDKKVKKHAELGALLRDMDTLRRTAKTPAGALEQILAFYTPILVSQYPDDYPKRQAGLEQLLQIAASYQDVDAFLADLSLDGEQQESRREDALVLSTVHSAKGLEWNAVLIIDLVQDRFPSKRALSRPEDLEEERRLLYVACTRARDELALFVPGSLYNRYNGITEPAIPSPFVSELPESCFQRVQESYLGGVRPLAAPASRPAAANAPERPRGPVNAPGELGRCKHKIFGPGKIVARLEDNKFRVNFPGFGLKVIVGDYLEML
ncbi:ATP-dependent helicase [Desulfovibrio aminophilus]|uniref:ATP-dependent helicase n=1 Tax=Desulfovibrio aminophilus TaxID=81425 RepID=UPI0004024E2A|nr:ATP-dependent helicase [Desulfovibrio aminophilus]